MLFGEKNKNSTFTILGDMARTREALRLDRRTDGQTNAISPSPTKLGEGIITDALCNTSVKNIQ